jgi:hypothetical protein
MSDSTAVAAINASMVPNPLAGPYSSIYIAVRWPMFSESGKIAKSNSDKKLRMPWF